MIQELASDIVAAIEQRDKTAFTKLFVRTCDALELDAKEAAAVFDTSQPNVRRWRSGEVVPPSAMMVYRFMLKELHAGSGA